MIFLTGFPPTWLVQRPSKNFPQVSRLHPLQNWQATRYTWPDVDPHKRLKTALFVSSRFCTFQFTSGASSHILAHISAGHGAVVQQLLELCTADAACKHPLILSENRFQTMLDQYPGLSWSNLQSVRQNMKNAEGSPSPLVSAAAMSCFTSSEWPRARVRSWAFKNPSLSCTPCAC